MTLQEQSDPTKQTEYLDVEDSSLAELHANALLEFDRIQNVYYSERMQCLEDRRFYSIAGAQWEGAVGEQFENKAKFEVNKVHLGVIRIINEYLNNKISVDFVNKLGIDNDPLASTCDGLYRNDEQDSQADEAYDNAFEESVGGGMGAWRLRTKYDDEEDIENDYQRIVFEPIYDADSCVFFDLGCKRQDKSDAKRCYVLSSYDIESYKEEFGDDPATWPKDVHQLEFDWASPEDVWVAELYQVEEVLTEYQIFEFLDETRVRHKTEILEKNPSIKKKILAQGGKLIEKRNIKKKRVHKYILSGGGVLEDCGFIPGPNIPVIVNYGKRWFVDGIERCMGHVRLTKDSQRLKNIQVSKLGEISAFSSVEKPIFTKEQIAGHTLMWSEDNVKDYPYMLINLIENPNGDEAIAGPLGYTKSPEVPPALAALLQLTEQDIRELLGNQEQGEEIVPNLSGRAVELVHGKLDMQSFIYLANFSKAIRRCGEVWLGMAMETYIETGRVMMGIGKQNEINSYELNRPVLSKKGELVYENDLTQAKMKVYADIGPASNSRKQAVIKNLTTLLAITQDPETQTVLNSMIMMNLEGEGVEEARQFFRKKLIKMGVLNPTEQEAAALAEEAENTPPDPNRIYLESAARKEDAEAEEAKAATVVKLADAGKKEAETLETLAGISREEEARASELKENLNNR